MPLVEQISLGLYIGVLTGVFTALVTFALSFSFKYVADVTFPSRMGLMLGLAVAGLQGSLYGLLRTPELISSPTILTALLVVMIISLYSHRQGKELGKSLPRVRLLRRIGTRTLSSSVVRRVGRFGQVRVRVAGAVRDVEGYPPLSSAVREAIGRETFTFPADLPVAELETRVADTLSTTYDLADVVVDVDGKGRATVAAAPAIGGLSRRVPAGRHAVSLDAPLPSDVARGDVVVADVGDDRIRGSVVSVPPSVEASPTTASPTGDEGGSGGDTSTDEVASSDRVAGDDAADAPRGRVTVAVPLGDVGRTVEGEVRRLGVTARGRRQEYELLSLLRRDGRRFRKLTLGTTSDLVGESLGATGFRDTYGVVVLGLNRFDEWLFAPDGDVVLRPGDELFVAGRRADLDRAAEAFA